MCSSDLLVVAWLRAAGWVVVARSERVGRDELDIVAIDPGPPAVLVVVEVRSAASGRFGAPEEKLAGMKIARTWRGALGLIRAGRLADGRVLPRLPWRVDAILVVRDRPDGAPRVRHVRGVAPERP